MSCPYSLLLVPSWNIQKHRLLSPAARRLTALLAVLGYTFGGINLVFICILKEGPPSQLMMTATVRPRRIPRYLLQNM